MNLGRLFWAISLIPFLAACSSGTSGTEIVELPRAPSAGAIAPITGAAYGAADEIGFSFDLFAGQRKNIRDVTTNALIRQETLLVSAVMNVKNSRDIEIITENLITKEKRVLSFALDDSRTVDQGTFIESFYNEVGATGTPQIVRIRRFDDGGHNAILRATDFDQESDLRASFSYGWRTDLAAATTPAMATYKGFGASEFFLSTPVKNAFGGTADLTADFTNRTISGVLFDNTGDRQDGIVATVTLNNGIINDNGTIAAASANDLTIVMDDNLLPVTSLTMKNSEVLGQFNGVGASSVSGAYGGTMTTTQTGLGTGDITFSGGFRASKQAP